MSKATEAARRWFIARRDGADVRTVRRLTDQLYHAIGEELPANENGNGPDFDALQREGLAGFLAFNAYHQEHGNKEAAIRALAEAILKVQALP